MSTNAKLYELIAEDVREGRIEMDTLLMILGDALTYLDEGQANDIAVDFGYDDVEYM